MQNKQYVSATWVVSHCSGWASCWASRKSKHYASSPQAAIEGVAEGPPPHESQEALEVDEEVAVEEDQLGVDGAAGTEAEEEVEDEEADE